MCVLLDVIGRNSSLRGRTSDAMEPVHYAIEDQSKVRCEEGRVVRAPLSSWSGRVTPQIWSLAQAFPGASITLATIKVREGSSPTPGSECGDLQPSTGREEARPPAGGSQGVHGNPAATWILSILHSSRKTGSRQWCHLQVCQRHIQAMEVRVGGVPPPPGGRRLGHSTGSSLPSALLALWHLHVAGVPEPVVDEALHLGVVAPYPVVVDDLDVAAEAHVLVEVVSAGRHHRRLDHADPQPFALRQPPERALEGRLSRREVLWLRGERLGWPNGGGFGRGDTTSSYPPRRSPVSEGDDATTTITRQPADNTPRHQNGYPGAELLEQRVSSPLQTTRASEMRPPYSDEKHR